VRLALVVKAFLHVKRGSPEANPWETSLGPEQEEEEDWELGTLGEM
jgi:hypothetical protein